MIKVESLGKVIGKKEILSDISFEVADGECVALIGPNGAGKTTLMSCLLGDRKATSGRVTLAGKPPKAKDNLEKVAVLTQENVIPSNLKVQELLDFFRAIYSNPLTEEEIDHLLCFSPEQKNQFSQKLSGGQRRLLSFVICLIGRPSLLFLDEPTAGMDTSTRQRFWEIVRGLKEKGVTIVYSSHYIEEVEHTAERILVLHQGKLLRDTTPFAMRSEEAKMVVTLPQHFLSLVEKMPEVEGLDIKRDRIVFQTRELEQVWQKLQEAGCRITDVEVQHQTLLNTLFDQVKEEEA